MRKIAQAVTATFIMAAASAHATVWNFKDVHFERYMGEGTVFASGYFVYDEASNTVTDWNISATPTGDLSYGLKFNFSDLSVDLARIDPLKATFVLRDDSDGRIYQTTLRFAQPLTAAGGEIGLTRDSSIGTTFSRVSAYGNLISGSITTSYVPGTPPFIPEPGTGFAFAFGLGGLALAVRRRHQKLQA